MDIKILHMIEGAKAARGITVIIDVFRAFSLEAYLFAGGAEKIFPIGDAELAYKLKKENPGYILAGERHGKILPGFDLGNSPSEQRSVNVMGRTVVHTTSAGTQGIANATGADEILGAALVNAKATAEYIKSRDPKEVSLVCMGLEALAETEEDNLCASYIEALLCERPFDLKTEAEKLRFTSGAKFFDPAQTDVFPTDDFFMCIDADKFDFVMKLSRSDNGPSYMTAKKVL